MSTRRQFLAQAGILLAGAPLLHRMPRSAASPRCIVVGAGLAGLSAARVLKEHGWEVIVLEARSRIGGRVFTHVMHEQPALLCELGAEWIGASHREVLSLCERYRLPLQKHTFGVSLLRDGRMTDAGRWGTSPESDARLQSFLAEWRSMPDERRRAIDGTDWWNHLRTLGFDEEELSVRDLLDSTDFGESIRHVSAAAAAGEYAESSPENEMDWKITGGNSLLIEALANDVGRAHIRLRSPVERIVQKDGRVHVDAGGERFTGDAVICAIPSSVLGAIMFDPPLPERTATAARRLQYARIVKNSMLCDRRYWGREDFAMIGDRVCHFTFHSTQRQPGVPGILTSYAIGDKADVLALQSDAGRLRMITADLSTVFPDAPALTRSIASYAWQRDRYTHGAYAVYRPGEWYPVREALSEPHGRVLFAGEHLADWQGFMEGAVQSGIDAARALLS